MLKSYCTIGWRNLVKNKVYSLINIVGLAIGLACCLGIGLFVYDEYSFDRFHTNTNNLYRIVEKQKQAGVYYNVVSTPGPLATAIKTDLPEVQESCRLRRTVGTLQIGQTTIEPSNIRYTDNSFFKLFDFKLLKGNATQVLLKPDEIVLTSATAKQLLGEHWQNRTDVLGTTITINAWGKERILTLVGVAEEPPHNSSIQYSALLSINTLADDDLSNWDNNTLETYIALNATTDPTAFNTKLETYIDRYSQYGSKEEARVLYLQPMKDIHLHSQFDWDAADPGAGNIVYVRIFLVVGIMVLLFAVFNFVNLSTARATSRAKEVGVRKVIGAGYKQLVMQFLTESFLLTTIAMTFSLVLAQVLLPWLNNVSGKALHVPLESPVFLGVITVTLMTVGLMAGLYPAFYLSKFAPSKVLKGISKLPAGFSFRQILVVGQFTFSVMLVIGAIVVYKQLSFIQEKDLGFDRSQLIYLPLRHGALNKESVVKDELKNRAGILSVAKTSSHIIEATNATTSFKWEGQQPGHEFMITQMNTDADLISTLGFSLAAGRNFLADTPDSTSFIVNETAASRMGWTPEQAIGKSVTFWQTQGTIVGVVKDFHFRPLTLAIEPFIFRQWTNARFNGLFIKTQPGQTRAAIATIEKTYKLHDDQTIPHYEFVDEALQAQYRTQQNTGSVVLFFSILAIAVSCLGLFGLATYATEQRTKEIGIRKILGANVSTILRLLSADFIKLVLIAITVAIPVAWYSMTLWLQDFAYKIALEWWIFATAGLITALIALATVSYHSIRTAIANPVNSLRAE